jgi:hypothetical protein
LRLAFLTCLVLVSPAGASEMNISQFIFRDLNRNGVYDVGESPYAGIPVRLTRPGNAPVVRESNLAGFANFVMSDDEGDITEPGPLEFVIEPPEGLEITTGNPRQHSEARRLDGSPAGIVIAPTLPFVGIAPALTIESSASGVETMICEGAGGTETAEVNATSGALSCAVSPGEWTITWTLQGGGTESRAVTVGGWPLRVPRPVPGISAGEQEATVRFDDILSSENIQEVPSGHGGVGWHNFVAAHHKFYEGWGYVNGTVSGEFSAYNSSGHPARIHSETPFDFLGATVSVAWPVAMNAPIRIEALRDGEVITADSFRGSNLRPIRFDPDWKGIDELRVSHGTYWQVIFDDVTLRR